MSQAVKIALAYGFGQLLMGPLSDKFGWYKVLMLSMFLAAVFALFALVHQSYSVLILSRLGPGLFASAVVASSLALIGQLFSDQKRGTIIARFMMAVITAQLSGSIIMGYVSLHFEVMFLVLAFLPLVGVMLLFPFRNEAILNERTQGNLLDHLGGILKKTHLPFIALLASAEGILVFGPMPYISVKLADFSTDSTIVGYAIACFAIGGLLFSITSPFFIRSLKQAQFTVGILCLAVVWFLIAYSTSYWYLFCAMLLVGLFFYILHNMLQANASNCYPPARASAMSLFMFSFFMGQGIGPIIFGSFVYLRGINESFVIFAFLSLAVGILSWHQRYKISDRF